MPEKNPADPYAAFARVFLDCAIGIAIPVGRLVCGPSQEGDPFPVYLLVVGLIALMCVLPIRWARELPGIGLLRPKLAVQAFDSSRRMMTFAHVSLLLVPLVGITAPTVLERTLRDPLRVRCVIAYQADAKARTVSLAYRRLTQEVAASSPRQRAAMRGSVEDIISRADAGGPGAGGLLATPAQLASALNLGEEEGAYLEYSGQTPVGGEPSPAPMAIQNLAAADAETQAEEADADADEGDAGKAGAAAAAAIGAAVSIPGGGAAVQILQEYLSGLTEEGPVADALARLAARFGADDADGADGADDADGADNPTAEQALDPEPAEQAVASGEISPAGGSGSQGSGDGDSSTGTSGDGSSNTGTSGGGGDGSGAGGGAVHCPAAG
jgi:uncharacterized membrane protein YgcG